jgi:hypothetical protein
MRFPRARGTLITSEATHAASFTISLEMVGAYRADGGEHFQLNPVCADPAFVVVHERVVQTHRSNSWSVRRKPDALEPAG